MLAIFAALALVLSLVGFARPVSATDTYTLSLHNAHGTTFTEDSEFGDGCEAGDDARLHFVANQLQAGTSPGSLTVEFEEDTISGITGEIVSEEGEVQTQFFFVTVPAEWTLVDAEATFDKAPLDNALLVLSDFECIEGENGDNGNGNESRVSAEVSKTADCAVLNNGTATVTGTITVENASGDDQTLRITSATDTIYGKSGPDRTELHTFTPEGLVGEEIDDGDSLTVNYEATFEHGDFTEFQNVIEITIENAETGIDRDMVFHFTVDFELCEDEVGAAMLSVEKSADFTSVDVGESITYTIVVENAAEATATAEDVEVTDDLADTLEVTSADFTAPDGDGDCTVGAGNTVLCEVGDLEAGESATVTIVVVTSEDDCGTVTNRAMANGAQSELVEVTVVCEEEMGTVELRKLFCETDGEASTEIHVFGPLEPQISTLNEDEQDELGEGCQPGDASFVITLDDEEVWSGSVGSDGLEHIAVPVGEGYVITEVESDVSSEPFDVDADPSVTAIVVLNFVPAEEQLGQIKILKFFCPATNGPDVQFSVDEPLDLVPGCEPGQAQFQVDDGFPFFTDEDGGALVWVTVGEHTLTELDPFDATSDPFEVPLFEGPDDIVEIIVVNFGEQAVSAEVNLTVLKTDQDEAPLPGVSFNLVGSGDVDLTDDTDSDGVAAFLALTAGDYTLFEDEPADCEGIGDDGVDISIQSDGTVLVEEHDAVMLVDDTTLWVVNVCGEQVTGPGVSQPGGEQDVRGGQGLPDTASGQSGEPTAALPLALLAVVGLAAATVGSRRMLAERRA